MCIIFVVLNKYLNCTVDKTIDTGHTASTDCNTYYKIVVLMMLFITSRCKLLKADTFRELCNYAT